MSLSSIKQFRIRFFERVSFSCCYTASFSDGKVLWTHLDVVWILFHAIGYRGACNVTLVMVYSLQWICWRAFWCADERLCVFLTTGLQSLGLGFPPGYIWAVTSFFLKLEGPWNLARWGQLVDHAENESHIHLHWLHIAFLKVICILVDQCHGTNSRFLH